MTGSHPSQPEPEATASPALRLTISPEPTEDELAALVTLVLDHLSRDAFQTARQRAALEQRPSRWVMAGRRAAHRRAPRERATAGQHDA